VTDGPGPRPPSGPFDDQGRLTRGRRSSGLASPVDGGPAGASPAGGWSAGSSPAGGWPAGGSPGGWAAPAPAPLNWTRSGPISLGATGPFSGPLTLAGGLTGGRRRKRQTVSGFDPVVRGRGLARLSRRPQPTTASQLQRACVRWVVTMWAMVILLQRFSVPGSPVALLVPASLAWCAYGLVRGVLEVDRYRFGWWLGAAGVSALIVPVQYAFVPRPIVSMNSWGLLLITWLVFVFHLRDRRRETYLRALAGMLRISLVQATLVLVFMASQLVTPYQDWLAQIIPSNLLLQGYTLAYQFSYGSPWYRSNGWIGLETSFTSIQLVLGIIAALLLRRKLPVILYLLAALASTGAQSGTQMLGVAVITILFSRMRWALARYLVLVPTLVAFLVSPLGRNTVTRLTEGTNANTSTGQRSTLPYELAWSPWVHHPLWVLFGRGPGSSQQMADDSHITGVIIPTPIKLFFDYGVVAGLALGVCLLFMFLGGPSRAYSLAMISSYWLFQPGTSILLVITVPLFITWWTPRSYPALESEFVPSPNAAFVPAQTRRTRTELLS